MCIDDTGWQEASDEELVNYCGYYYERDPKEHENICNEMRRRKVLNLSLSKL